MDIFKNQRTEEHWGEKLFINTSFISRLGADLCNMRKGCFCGLISKMLSKMWKKSTGLQKMPVDSKIVICQNKKVWWFWRMDQLCSLCSKSLKGSQQTLFLPQTNLQISSLRHGQMRHFFLDGAICDWNSSRCCLEARMPNKGIFQWPCAPGCRHCACWIKKKWRIWGDNKQSNTNQNQTEHARNPQNGREQDTKTQRLRFGTRSKRVTWRSSVFSRSHTSKFR